MLPLLPPCLLVSRVRAAGEEMSLPGSAFLSISLLTVRTGEKTFQLLLHFYSIHFLRPLWKKKAVSHLLLLVALSDNSTKQE